MERGKDYDPAGFGNRRLSPGTSTPESDHRIEAAIEDYSTRVRGHFPGASAEFHSMGGIALPNELEDPELNLAVIFHDDGWNRFERIGQLGELASDTLLETGVLIHGKPFLAREWAETGDAKEPSQVRRQAQEVR